MAESKNRKHALLRVEPRNYEAMIDKLQDMNINHRRESDTVIKLYTDGIPDKVLYNLTHDVYVDKFVLKEEIKSTLNEGRYENIEHMFSGEPDPMGNGDELDKIGVPKQLIAEILRDEFRDALILLGQEDKIEEIESRVENSYKEITEEQYQAKFKK